MKYDVFISYSRKDYVDANKQVIPGNIVSQIKALFDKNGISYWFDEEGIYSGDAFARVIARNIKASKMLLFISTANSNQSQWTSDEIAVAREYGKKIIPFRYDQSHYNEDVIIYIARLDYIDYLANPKVALNRLLSSVKEFLQTESQKEIEKKRAEEQRIMEERLINERAKRVQVIDDSIVKHKDELRSIEQSIIECEKSLLELKYKRDKLNVALKELNDERVALLSFVHMTQNQTQAKTIVQEYKIYNVGDYYDDGEKQGVVFAVWDGGKHGKIVSLDQSNETLFWCEGWESVAVKAISSTDGRANTLRMISRRDKNQYPAFKWCESKGADWYFPAIDELALLLLNSAVYDAVNKTLKQLNATKLNDRLAGKGYWSSTERDMSCAWAVSMRNMNTFILQKYGYGSVRAVATF